MNIVFLDRSTLGYDVDLGIFDELGNVITYDITTPSETLERVKEADVVVTNKVVIDKEIMDNSDIKLICVAATGMNNIDLEYAAQKNIAVKNAVGYSTPSVVQMTFSFALHFMQHLNFYKSYVDNGEWQKSPIFTNLDKPFNELGGKKWGVIGLGNIGAEVASVAKAFGCEVSYYSTSGANNNTNYPSISLEQLLEESDIISVHCPLNDTTKGLLNSTNMKQLKDKAIVLNLGRGGIIDEQSILEIADSKEVYFGIDVVSKEPIDGDSPLLKVKNKERLLLTPHIGWASVEARQRLIKCVFDNISEFVL